MLSFSPTRSQPALRPMQQHDLAAAGEIQAACYAGDLLEPAEILRQRLHCAPDTCWVASESGRVVAYLVAYRSLLGKITPLHAPFDPAPQPDTLYIHDLAVHPAAKGCRLGGLLVTTLLTVVRREKLRHSALVSLQGSKTFWARQGYRPHVLSDRREQLRLAGYGDAPCYMSRPL